jgi:hypothetical protein
MALQERAMIDREAAPIAYAAYAEVTGGKNFRGDPMPEFDDLPETIREAWTAAVCVIRERTEDYHG